MGGLVVVPMEDGSFALRTIRTCAPHRRATTVQVTAATQEYRSVIAIKASEQIKSILELTYYFLNYLII